MIVHGLMLCDDLIFFSRVECVARAAGLTIRQMRDAEGLLKAIKAHSPGGIIADLHNPGLDLPLLLKEVKEVSPTPPRVVAYGSHVEAEVLSAARKAGCDLVMPRSQFVEKLEHDLPAWLGIEAKKTTASQ